MLELNFSWVYFTRKWWINRKLLTIVACGLQLAMLEIRKTELFVQWLDSLRDRRARARVQARIERLAMGNPGDVRPVGEGISELKIDYGPGYRVYFTRIGREIVILLARAIKALKPQILR
jgi:putative addiction module killer protein